MHSPINSSETFSNPSFSATSSETSANSMLRKNKKDAEVYLSLQVKTQVQYSEIASTNWVWNVIQKNKTEMKIKPNLEGSGQGKQRQHAEPGTRTVFWSGANKKGKTQAVISIDDAATIFCWGRDSNGVVSSEQTTNTAVMWSKTTGEQSGRGFYCKP